MQVLDPGHMYVLNQLDVNQDLPTERAVLTFVKRNSPPEKYPGNKTAYPGTTLQETIRAQIDRLKYVNKQQPDSRNLECISLARHMLFLLECRAASLHGRTLTIQSTEDIEDLPTCSQCGHIHRESDHQKEPVPVLVSSQPVLQMVL